MKDNQDRDLVLRRRKEKSLYYNNSFLGEYECSSLELDGEERRDKKRLDHLKQDQTINPNGQLVVVLTVPDISEGRLSTWRAAPRLTLPFLSFSGKILSEGYAYPMLCELLERRGTPTSYWLHCWIGGSILEDPEEDSIENEPLEELKDEG
nr:hypothetical protein [Tanacetum cinerariifolium]